MSSDGTGPSAGEAHSPTKPPPKVVLEGVEQRYGDVLALAALDLTVEDGEFLTLLGPSGCGKTTTLRIIAGFVDPTAGRVLINGAMSGDCLRTSAKWAWCSRAMPCCRT